MTWRSSTIPRKPTILPSDPAALKKFLKAAGQLGIAAELITRDDYGSLMEYDALFIRATTDRQPFHVPVCPAGRTGRTGGD